MKYTATELVLKAVGFTSANFDGEVAAMMLGIDEPTDEQVDELEDAFAKLYREIDEGERVIMRTTRSFR